MKCEITISGIDNVGLEIFFFFIFCQFMTKT